MPQPADLDRFRQAQDQPVGGHDTALAEIRSGRKQSHWIWYVFPQLSGLGRSGFAAEYGIRGREEALAYLRDPVLRDRLLTLTAAVADHARRGVSLDALMNSRTDALKLVSSLTLFESVARDVHESDGDDRCRSLADAAASVLETAARQGYPRCRFTLDVLDGPRRG